MSEEEPTHLSPAEAGAFVAQWAETRPVDFADLARRLNVAETQSASLLRQARGRLAMERWLQQQQPQKSPVFVMVGLIAGAFVLGGILMFMVQPYFSARHETPVVTVTTSGPEQQPSVAPPTPNPAEPLSDGSQLGTTLGKITKGEVPPESGPTGTRPSISTSVADAALPSSSATRMRRPVELTADLKQPMPDDLFIEVITDKGPYVRHGDITKDEAAAKLIPEGQVTLALEGMVREVLQRDPSAKNKPATVTFRLGRASTEAQLDWSLAVRTDSLGSSSDPGTQYYESLVAPILQKIHDLPDLFGVPPPKGGSKL